MRLHITAEYGLYRICKECLFSIVFIKTKDALAWLLVVKTGDINICGVI